MSVYLPLWVVAAQWILLLGLGLLVIAMYRQMGYYMRLQRLGSESFGLPIGGSAPSFDYVSASGAAGTPQHFNPRGQWSLLVFADPQCASCDRALYALEALRKGAALGNVHTIVVTHADATQLARDEAFQTTTAEVALVTDGHLADVYRLRQTPFAYLVDSEGIIRAKGKAEDQRSLQEILKAA